MKLEQLSLPTCRFQVCERRCHRAKCPYEHEEEQTRFLRQHMRRRVYGPLDYWAGRWAATVHNWDPWKEKGIET